LAKIKKKSAPVTAVPATSSQVIGSLRIRKWKNTVMENAKRLAPYHLWIEALALLLILGVGLFVRTEDIRDWNNHPELALYKGEPLLTTFDGYFYLTLAKDLAEGTYTSVDKNRDVPRGVSRKIPPPLISMMAAGLAKITPFSLNWIGAVLPALLGLLLALPLYALGRFYGGPAMGLTAALMGLLSHYYVYRSSLGWFDTDCMNVTWATGAAFCFLRFGIEVGWKRYVYFICGMAIFLLFLWWWDQTPQVTTVVSMLPLAVALVFFYRPGRREAFIFLGIVGLGIGAILLWMGLDLPLKIFRQVASSFYYISTKEVADIWPPIGATISEQVVPSLAEIVAKTTGSLPAFIFACAGLACLFYRRPKESLFLSVPLILAALSFFFAKRFLIFVAPVTALGIGYMISEIWSWRRKISALFILAPILVIVLVWPALSKDMDKTFWPKEPPHLIAGMDKASRETPKDAVIWAWWDHGYPLNYWAERGTVGDGSLHGGERSFYNGLPFATHDERLAANFMRFYVGSGMDGIRIIYQAVGNDPARGVNLIKQVLSAGPEKARELLISAKLKPIGSLQDVNQWLRFFYPEKTRPVYLFLDWRLTITSYWWYWLGTWDLEKREGIHPVYKAFYNVREENGYIKGSEGLDINIEKGTLRTGNSMIGLTHLVKRERQGILSKSYQRDSGPQFEMWISPRFGALMDTHISESVFNKLFLRYTFNPEYFRPVVINTPSHQLWEVVGDMGR
jgi:dolichyl-diphosphooligosaccharide--protein glycosyltransferase